MPSGIEIEEFPRSRMRLRRKANRTDWPFSREASSKEASAGARGMRLTMRRTMFMVATKAPEVARKQTSVSYGRVARPQQSRVEDSEFQEGYFFSLSLFFFSFLGSSEKVRW